MQISAAKIKKNDFIKNFGIVSKINYFYIDQSVKGKSPLEKFRYTSATNYARLVAKQAEDSYNSLLDNVVVTTTCGKVRTFSADSIVDIYRMKVAV